MTINNQKKILFVWTGPIYAIQSYKYNELSKNFSGYVLGYSTDDKIIATTKIDAFEFLCLKTKHGSGVVTKIKYAVFCIKFAIKQRFKVKNKIDLVVSYDPLKTGIIGAIVSRVLSTKFAPEINGTYHSHFNFMDKSKNFAKMYAFLYTIVMKIVFSFAHGIKYQYPGQISFLKNPQKKYELTYFPNLVNFEKFVNIREDKEIIVVGFPFWRKGIDVAINAFKLIAKDFPDWKLKILGWLPDIAELNQHIGDCSQIYHHKAVFYNEMPDHIGTCGIVCCSSRSEGVPRVLIEAMMAEKPRIGSTADGIPTLIEDNVDGLLFENENYKQLAEKMALLIKDEKMRKEFGVRGKEKVLREFSPQQYYKKLITFYEKLME